MGPPDIGHSRRRNPRLNINICLLCPQVAIDSVAFIICSVLFYISLSGEYWIFIGVAGSKAQMTLIAIRRMTSWDGIFTELLNNF
jgi:hypothetical protein